MPIVNFSIPKNLDIRIKNIVLQKGFPSKAELFRFAMIKYLDKIEEDFEDMRMEYLTEELGKAIEKKFKNKKLPSAKEQLKKLHS